MMVVDSSVWVANMRDMPTEAVRKLRTLDEPEWIIVGDLILLEVLQGVRDEQHARQVERYLRRFKLAPMIDIGLAVRAARNHRLLRQRGVTVRKIVDLVVGTYCIDHGFELLHQDRDFDPMAEHLGLRVA